MDYRKKQMSSNTKIRLAIIGCGVIVRAQHIPAIRHTGLFDIAALCDPVRDSAASAAVALCSLPAEPAPSNQHHALDAVAYLAQNYFPSHTEMLAVRRDIDAVLIATPNNSHARIAGDCLRAGLDLFCEKPAALTVEEHDLLNTLAAQTGRIFQVGLVLRYSPIFQYAHSVLTSGRIGQPQMMFLHEFRPFAFQPWRYSREISGGMFIEKNCHHFDLFHWMLCDSLRPKRVVAFGGQNVLKDQPRKVWALRDEVILPASEIIDHAWVLIEYEKGIKAQLGITFFCPFGREFRMGIIGDRGKIDIYEMERAVFIYDGKDKIHQQFPPDQAGFSWQKETGYQEYGAVHSGALEQWLSFASCVKERKQPFCNLAKAKESIRIALAAEDSLTRESIIRL
jgi:predicted dehydrogenase